MSTFNWPVAMNNQANNSVLLSGGVVGYTYLDCCANLGTSQPGNMPISLYVGSRLSLSPGYAAFYNYGGGNDSGLTAKDMDNTLHLTLGYGPAAEQGDESSVQSNDYVDPPTPSGLPFVMQRGDLYTSNETVGRLAIDGTPNNLASDIFSSVAMGSYARLRPYLGYQRDFASGGALLSTYGPGDDHNNEYMTVSHLHNGFSAAPPFGSPAVVVDNVGVMAGKVHSLGFITYEELGIPIPYGVAAVMGNNVGVTPEMRLAVAGFPGTEYTLQSWRLNSQLHGSFNRWLTTASRAMACRHLLFGTPGHFVQLMLDSSQGSRVESFLDYTVYDDFDFPFALPNTFIWTIATAGGTAVQCVATPAWDPASAVATSRSLYMLDANAAPGSACSIAHDLSNRDDYSSEEVFITVFAGISITDPSATFYLEFWEDNSRTNLVAAIRFLVAGGVPVSLSYTSAPGPAWTAIAPVTNQFGPPTPTFIPNAWYAIQLKFDLNGGNYDIWVNGTFVATAPIIGATNRFGYFIANTGDGVIEAPVASSLEAYLGLVLISRVEHDIFTSRWGDVAGNVPLHNGTLQTLYANGDADSSYDSNHQVSLFAGYGSGANPSLYRMDFRIVNPAGTWPWPIPKNFSAVGVLTESVTDICPAMITPDYDNGLILVGTENGVRRYDLNALPGPEKSWLPGSLGGVLGTRVAPLVWMNFTQVDVAENTLGFVAGDGTGATGAAVCIYNYSGGADSVAVLTTANGLLAGSNDTIHGVASLYSTLRFTSQRSSLLNAVAVANDDAISYDRPSLSYSMNDQTFPVANLYLASSTELGDVGDFTRLDSHFGNVLAVGTEEMGVWLLLPGNADAHGKQRLVSLILPALAGTIGAGQMGSFFGMIMYPSIGGGRDALLYNPQTRNWGMIYNNEEFATINHSAAPLYSFNATSAATAEDGYGIAASHVQVAVLAATKEPLPGGGVLTGDLYAIPPGGAPALLASVTVPDGDRYAFIDINPALWDQDAETLFYIDVTAWPIGAATARFQVHGPISL